jgi:aminomuconate-semialdehyde/2-hydroxymuconate-6-semialdehyde dehydrogenase
VAQFRLGDPFDPSTTHGPIISHDHRDKVLAAYHTASSEGAQVVIGGGVPEMPPSLSAGAWIEPTLWTGLSEGASTLTEEIFGPCAHIAPFDSEEQVVAQCSDERYGLASVIWTRDQSRAAAVSRRMRTGMVWVNTWLERDLEFPFGGMRQSGVGREGGLHSIDFHTDARYIIEKF